MAIAWREFIGYMRPRNAIFDRFEDKMVTNLSLKFGNTIFWWLDGEKIQKHSKPVCKELAGVDTLEVLTSSKMSLALTVSWEMVLS